MVETPTATILMASVLDRAALAEGMTVADLGCGVSGHAIIPAAQRVGEQGKAYAVDIQRSALAATESRAKLAGVSNVTSVWSDLERPGATSAIPPGSLDVAMLVSTLHLAHDPLAMLRETVRLTKVGGRVIVIDWKPGVKQLGPAATQRITPEAVRAAAQHVGLVEQGVLPVSSYHFGLLFVKS